MSKRSSRLMKAASDEKKDDFSPSLKKRRKIEVDSEASSSKRDEREENNLSSVSHTHAERLLSAHPFLRPSPIPDLSWGDSNEVWKNLVEKEMTHLNDPAYFERHPELKPKMRAILFDWLIEVCEVYRLHRETFYLSQDLIDRFLTLQNDSKKDRLQLIGITCLFIAAKVEEIYPPKLTEFAYVTDGACTDSEILQQELIILMTLNWDVTPVTICTWLSTFLQIASFRESDNKKFEERCFDTEVFVKLCQVLDLCILDVGCLKFRYSVLAASVIIHLVSEEVGLFASAYEKADVEECVEWMKPFAEVVSELKNSKQKKFFENVLDCDMHNIQTHDVGLNLLDEVHSKQCAQVPKEIVNDDLSEIGILTPPQSTKKPCLRRGSP